MACPKDDPFLDALEDAMRAEFSSLPQNSTPDPVTSDRHQEALDRIKKSMDNIDTIDRYLSRTIPEIANGINLFSGNSFWNKIRTAFDPARDPATLLADVKPIIGELLSMQGRGINSANTRPAHTLPDTTSIFSSILAKGQKLQADMRTLDVSEAETNIVHLEPFSYDALPSETSIRVLRLDKVNEESKLLKLTVHVIDLKDSPRFNALSYVWADHRPQLHQSYHPNRSWRTFPVMCNGYSLKVTYNLFQALLELQKRQRVSPMNDIWIDQVCINQEDMLERGSQVAIMGDIYRSAENVLSWLGPEDRYTEEALNFLRKLAAIPEEKYEKIAQDIAPFILELPSTSWESLSSLLSRPYFNRVWVVQEVVLAKNLTMICGSKDFSWRDLIQVSKFLQITKPWALLTDHAARFISVEDRLDSKKSGMPMAFGSQLSSLIEVKARTMDPRIPWQEILVIGRQFGATKPQDKFYAMLGLVKERLSSTMISVDLPSVDYFKPADDVTLQFSRIYLDATQNLQLLNNLEDVEYRTSKALPSWVPDSQSRLLPIPLDYTSHNDKMDTISTKPCFSLDSSGRILHVQGTQMDTITEISASFNEIQDSHNWLSILKLLKSISTSNDSIDEIFIRTLLTIPYSFNSQKPSPSLPLLDFGIWMIKNLSRIGPGAGGDYTTSNGVFDMLSITSAYVDDVVSDFDTFGRSGLYQPRDLSNDPTTKLFLKGVDSLNHEFHGRIGLVKLLKDTKQLLEELWNLNRSGAFPSPSRVKETLNVLNMFEDGSPERETVQRSVELFQTRLGMRLHSRRMFITKSGRLGLGPQSLQVGDEIYSLRGAAMPFVLRRREEGGYQVVGHSFILDLLEAGTPRDNLVLQKISLV